MVTIEKNLSIYYNTVFSYCQYYIPLRSFNEKNPSLKPYNMWIEANPETAINDITAFAKYADSTEGSSLCIPGTVKERGQAKAVDICQMQVICIDIDSGDIAHKRQYVVDKVGIPTLIVGSGGITEEGQQKLHIYWKLSEACEGRELERLLECRRVLTLKVGADEHFASAHQPIRIAGTIYHKGNVPKEALILEFNDVEYHLFELEDIIHEMAALPGTILKAHASLISTNTNLSYDQLKTIKIRSGNRDETSRYEAISIIMGHLIRQYHEGSISQEEMWERIRGHNLIYLDPPWDEDTISYHVKRLWERHCAKEGKQKSPKKKLHIKYKSIQEYENNKSPPPINYIEKGLLTPQGLMVFAGPPKIGKSFFILTMLLHMAAGVEYLDFIPSRKLKICYMQAEVTDRRIEERIEAISVPIISDNSWKENFIISDRTQIPFSEEGLETWIKFTLERCGSNIPDVICIDPLRNFYHSERNNDENSVSGMRELWEKINRLREAINPDAGIILVHHSKKIDKNLLKDDVFNAIAGSGALRGLYTTGILLYCVNEELPNNLRMSFEVRDKHPKEDFIRDKEILREGGIFVNHGNAIYSCAYKAEQKNNADRARKQEKILELIANEAEEGRIYGISHFAERFEGKYNIGSKNTIIDRINVLATNGWIRFFKDPENYGLNIKRISGQKVVYYMSVCNMQLLINEDFITIKPDYFKNKDVGYNLVENVEIWSQDIL